MVALVLVVLPLSAERTCDCAPIVVRHFGFAAGVGLLLLPLDNETFPLIAVRGMKQATLLISILDIAHEASIFGGSPLSRSGSLVPSASGTRKVNQAFTVDCFDDIVLFVPLLAPAAF